ncbi:MAG TPA: hypothetical protein VNW29_05715 [Candidatus Sulfotelmatobacter sp.]|jgi:hypothetical protein|nr:hypothetical protein [Candidatus Sulfotelmatobacter sp.]
MKKLFGVSNFVQKLFLFIVILYFAFADLPHVHVGTPFENVVSILARVVGFMFPIWIVVFLLQPKKSLSIFLKTSFSVITLLVGAAMMGLTTFINPYQGSIEGLWALGYIVMVGLLLYALSVACNIIKALWQNRQKSFPF